MSQITITYRTLEDADRVDLTRIGIVVAASGNRLKWSVEPQIDGWDAVPEGTRNEILASGLHAAGVWAGVTTRSDA